MHAHSTVVLLIAVLALGFFSTIVTARIAYDSTTCSNTNKNVVNANGKFCQNKTLYIPSVEAANGMYSDNMKVSISITGICTRVAQYVPQDVYFHQFWNMCAASLSHGAYQRCYGYKGNNCQIWQINVHSL